MGAEPGGVSDLVVEPIAVEVESVSVPRWSEIGEL